MPGVKIDKGIKPKRLHGNGKYPFADMKIGDSVVSLGRTYAAPYVIAKAASKRLAPMKFRGGKDEKGKYRIWRVE